MRSNCASVTVSTAAPVIPSRVAVIVVDGGLTPTVVARPSNPAAFLIVATDGTEELQST